MKPAKTIVFLPMLARRLRNIDIDQHYSFSRLIFAVLWLDCFSMFWKFIVIVLCRFIILIIMMSSITLFEIIVVCRMIDLLIISFLSSILPIIILFENQAISRLLWI